MRRFSCKDVSQHHSNARAVRRVTPCWSELPTLSPASVSASGRHLTWRLRLSACTILQAPFATIQCIVELFCQAARGAGHARSLRLLPEVAPLGARSFEPARPRECECLLLKQTCRSSSSVNVNRLAMCSLNWLTISSQRYLHISLDWQCVH